MNSRKDYITKVRVILTISLLFVFLNCSAQQALSNPVRWSVNETENLRNNEKYSYTCSFVTSENEVKWIQKNGMRITRFNITSIEGEWSDLGVPGRLVLFVKEGDLSGKIILEKTETERTLTIDFSSTSPTAIWQRFNVLTIQPED